MSTAQKLIAATSGAAGPAPVDPIGIDFDGTNDFLIKTSDLTGNADGKTFTLSFFAYTDVSGSDAQIYRIEQSGSVRGFVNLRGSGELRVGFYNSGGSQILNFQTNSTEDFSVNTWTHYLLSVDMTDSSATKCYKNDEAVTFTQSVFTNDNIDFTCDEHLIKSSNGSSSDSVPQRLAGIYLDYTFRDLTTTSNRRLFIDADGLYVTPPTGSIMNVTMDDPADPGRNDGTGGDFTLNGVVAQSGRGPNQYNAAASIFDGVGTGDKLVRTSQLTGISDTKTGTFRFSVNSVPDSGTIMCVSTDSAVGTFALVRQTSGGDLIVSASNASSSNILTATLTGYSVKDKWETHCITFDLSDTSKRAWLVDGVATSPTWSTYTNDTIDYTRAESAIANQYGTGSGASPFKGTLSDLWFDNSYTADLSVFYDTVTGKPKSLGADGSTPTGSSPKIYLPLRGDNAGENKGTGGDFTVNSGPFTGARGPSEFWGSAASFNGSSQYLNRTSALSGASDGKILTFAVAFNANSIGNNVFRISDGGGDGTGLNLSGGDIGVYGQASDTANVLWMRKGTSLVGASGLSTDTWHTVLFSANLTNASLRHWYVDNVSVPSPTIGAYTNTNIDFTNTSHGVGARGNGSDKFNGEIGFLYVSQEYIDFSSEANRLKFFDAFGFPVDLGSDGSTPTGTQPLIYINKGFHSGTNSGSGGNFTAQGTPTDGGYVKG